MWNFEASYKYGDFNLHDCLITSIEDNHGNIVLNFANGYWIDASNPQNPYGKNTKTYTSSLTLVNAKCEDIVFGGKKFSWIDFCSNINSGKWSFECNDECYSDNKSVYLGYVRVGEVYYDPNPECNIWFTFQNLLYNWDAVHKGKRW
jgi:hypothetical protein